MEGNRFYQSWSEEKVQELTDYLAKKTSSFEGAAKKFGASIDSIKRVLDKKAGTRSLPTLRGWISIAEIGIAFGYDRRSVKEFIAILERRNYPFLTIYNNRRYTTIEEFWEFVKENPNSVRLNRLERGILIPEPNWLTQAIANYEEPKRRWTKHEKTMLFYYKDTKNFPIPKIAEILNRDEKSVYMQIYDENKRRALQ